MKAIISFVGCFLIGIVVGWHFGHTHSTAKNEQDVSEQYHDFQILKRQEDDVISGVALIALKSIEDGSTNKADNAAVQILAFYHHLYSMNWSGGDTNIFARINEAAKKDPALAAELEKRKLTN